MPRNLLINDSTWKAGATKYLLGFILLATLFLGFGPISIEAKKAYFQTYSFSLVFISVVIWIWALLPRSLSKQNILPHIPAFLIAFFLIAALSLLSPTNLRVLYDETNLLGVSQAMFEHRTFYIPTQALFHNQNTYIINYEWGVRPLVFPFFLYLIHLVNGYAVTNVYLLNAGAGLASLFFFYLLLQRFFSKTIAIFGMALLSAYPIFALRTTSGGYEIVNLGFAIFAFYQCHHAITSEKRHHTTRLIFTLVLLAQIRYESVLFLCALGPFMIWNCIQHRHSRPNNITLLVPILLLPIAWQRILYSGDDAFMVRENSSMFGVSHFLTNLEHAFDFFSGTQSAYGTIPIILYLAILGLFTGLTHFVRRWKRIPYATRVMLLSAGPTFTLLATVTLGYILGDMTRPIGLRWGIIFLPFLIVPIVYLGHLVAASNPRFLIPLGLATAIVILFGWSGSFQNASVHGLRLNQINQAYMDFFRERDPQKRALIVSPFSRLFVPDQRSAVTFEYANQNWQEIMGHLQNGLVEKIFICQIADAQNQALRDDTRLTHGASLETLGELQIGSELFGISKISLPK
jgi:hypothetical protein